jgi:two-component system response regulator HydG
VERIYHAIVVDDETANLESFERILKSDGAKVRTFRDARGALQALSESPCDVLVTDLRMQSVSGMELLESAKEIDPTIEVILITAYGTVEIAVEAMKKGAYDFVTKPVNRVQLLKAIHRALEKRKLVHENSSLREELQHHFASEGKEIISRSVVMRGVLDVVTQAARSRANVLIEGESGTGKGLLAEYLHRLAGPQSGMFVKINCSAIPENLLEAELFGYEVGAFTGAVKRKKGRLELAHKGSLFLDEIGIAPLTFQAKLLRFLQEGEFERLGSNDTLQVEARILSATNAHLQEMIRQGTFREDLYYRLNVIHIRVPPLRDRPEDIPLLVNRFLDQSARKNGRAKPLLHSDALECLIQYSWPGNVRELQNWIERLVVLNRTGVIQASDLPSELGGKVSRTLISVPLGMPIRQVERVLMGETLKRTQGDKRKTARLLGVHPRTIYRYLEEEVTGLPEGGSGTEPPLDSPDGAE